MLQMSNKETHSYLEAWIKWDKYQNLMDKMFKLFQFCLNAGPGFTVSIMQGHVTLYKHAGYTMENYAALDLLKQLPMIESIGGMAKIFFQTDSSGTLSGFVLRYFAKSKHIGN